MIEEKMLARIGSIYCDGTEDFNDVGYLKDKVEVLQYFYKEIMNDKTLFHNIRPHYIDVEYPVELLEYCLTLKPHTDTIHSNL